MHDPITIAGVAPTELDVSSPEDLDKIAYHIDRLRATLLFEPLTAGLSPVAEQHFLIALDLLSQAKSNMTLASLHQARALAGG